MDYILLYAPKLDTENIYFSISPTQLSITPLLLEEVIQQAETKKIILVVPGKEVISLQKTLPKMPLAKIQKALPFAIEDQLLDAIHDYHLVVTQISEEGQVSLLTVLKDKMQAWLLPFAKKISLYAMIPDYLLLPDSINTWHIALAEKVLIRTGAVSGLVCDKNNWQMILNLLWQECPDKQKPSKIIITYYQEDLPNTELLTRLPCEIEKASDSLMATMAKNIGDNLNDINLLKHQFTQEQHLSPTKKIWLRTGIILASALIVSFLGNLTQLIILKKQDNLLQEKITAIYKTVYPSATSVVAPQVRMQRTLADLENNNADSGYLGLLAKVGKTLKTIPAINVTAIRYQDNHLILDLQALNFSSFALALSQLNQAGLNAKQENAATKDNQVTARFTIGEA